SALLAMRLSSTFFKSLASDCTYPVMVIAAATMVTTDGTLIRNQLTFTSLSWFILLSSVNWPAPSVLDAYGILVSYILLRHTFPIQRHQSCLGRGRLRP